MNCSGNMPDWHQYNSAQPIGSEVPSVSQNVIHTQSFGPAINPRRLNGSGFSLEGLSKPPTDASYNARNFPLSPSTMNGSNGPETSPMGSTVQIPGCIGHYGTPSPRNTMIESTNSSLESRNGLGTVSSESIGHQTNHLQMNGPVVHLNSTAVNSTMTQRSTSIQGPITPKSRQGLASYMPCKGPCCNPENNVAYHNWEKFGPYPPNVQYRDANYPVDNRRFNNDFNPRKDAFDNREAPPISAATYAVDPRRNFPDYKYRKEPLPIPRGYAAPPPPPPPNVVQSYPVQNYFPADYQKYPTYPMKDYSRETSVGTGQNPAILKYQEQSVIVQQKYFTKQIQYPNGATTKDVIPTSLGANIISRAQNPYFNPQLGRDLPRDYTENTALANRGLQATTPIQSTYSKYQMYQQKIAMQRFSMENHLRELSRIPGYQSHPKYQECILRYRELLRLQQTVEYQSTVQDSPRVVNAHVNEEIPPINLQFDQNGVLINSNYTSHSYSGVHRPTSVQNSKNLPPANSLEVTRPSPQQSERYQSQERVENQSQAQDSSSFCQTSQSRDDQEDYSVANNFRQEQFRTQTYANENVDVAPTECATDLSSIHGNSKDFADKPELDVRQFLANWDESEDEDGPTTTLPEVVSSNATTVAADEYENVETAEEVVPEKTDNCSEMKDCDGTEDRASFVVDETESKPSHPVVEEAYERDVSSESDVNVLSNQNCNDRDAEKKVSMETEMTPSPSEPCGGVETVCAEKTVSDQTDDKNIVKMLCENVKAENNDVEGIRTELPMKNEEESVSSITAHIDVYNADVEADTYLATEALAADERVDDARSNRERRESVESHSSNDFDSSESCSESDSSDSETNESESVTSTDKVSKGSPTTKRSEITIDSQELSAIPPSLKSSCTIADNQNLQKQHSFVSEESHNPDDISLPDLHTSEYTPISTTLNTPIHSDSEDSSEHIIDLTIPAYPIEIIQNSPMLSFTHSPIKMEPYERFDDTDPVDETSRDLNFDVNNSCDNDFDHSRSTSRSTSVSPQFASVKSDECTSESESVDVLNDKSIVAMKPNAANLVARNNLSNDIIDNEIRASSNKIADADCQSWPTINEVKDERRRFRDMEREDCKLECIRETSTKSSSSIADENNKSEKVETRKPFGSDDRDETIEVETDRFVQVDDGIVLNLAKPHVLNSDTSNVANNSRDEGRDDAVVSSNNDKCLAASETQPFYRMSSEQTELHATPSVCEVKLGTEISENQANFSGSLHIALIPGEDFDEPKIPVLPMEGNCLTKILKNTSPITNLDVLGSDDEKLGKMDDLWIEVDCVEANSKVVGNPQNPSKQRTTNSLRKLRKLGKEFDGSKTCGNTVESGIHGATVISKISPKKDNDFAKLESSVDVEGSHLDASKKQTESANSDRPRGDSSSACDLRNAVATKREEHCIESLQITSKSSSSSLLPGDGLGNNNAEKSKCRVKANHINDIATKLLENARQIEPEKKMEVLKKEDGIVKASRPDACDTDGTKKRMKLLKEFRKVKNKRWEIHHSVLPSTTGDLGARIESTSAIPNAGMEMEDTMFTTETKQVEDSIFEKQNLNESVSSNASQSNSVIPDPLDKKIEDKSQTICDTKLHFIATSDPKSSDNVKVQGSEKYEPSEGNESSEVDNLYGTANENLTEIDNSVPSGSGEPRLPDSFVKRPDILCETNVDDIAINLSTSSRDLGKETFTNVEECSIEASLVCDIKSTEPSLNVATVNCDSDLSELARMNSNNSSDNNRKRNEEIYNHEFEIEKDDQNGNAVGSSDDCRAIDDSSDKAVRSEFHQPNKSDHLEKPSQMLQTSPEVIENLDHKTADENEKMSECADEKPSEHSMRCSTAELVSDEKNDQAYEGAVALENPQNLETKSLENEDTLLEVTPALKNMEANLAIDEKVRGTMGNMNVDVDAKQENIKSTETFVERSSAFAEPKFIADEVTAADLLTLTIGDSTITEVLERTPRKPQRDDENSNSAVISDDVWKTDDDTTGMQLSKESKRANDDDCSNKISGCTNVSAEDRKNVGSPNAVIDTFFTHDFNNFDVAPNIENDEDEQNENWKHSKAHARYEDCERYKNPDNLTDPIFTSLGTLDNLNTVPVYTTKDGKITYSPNPKFTYRALIVEAREREGYPATLSFYHDDSKTQESYHRGRSQGAHRKRKPSEDCSGVSNYGKRNHYEPRYHGETSSKYSSDSRHRRSAARPLKYRRYSRDDYPHNSSYDNDSKKPRSSERLVQDKNPERYKYSDTHDPSNERRKRKDIVQSNFQNNDRNVSKQSKDPSSSDFLHSRSRKNINQGPINAELTPCRSQTKEQRSLTNNIHEDIFGLKNHPTDDSKNDANVKEILPERLDAVARAESCRHSCNTEISIQQVESDNLNQEQYKKSDIIDSKVDVAEVCKKIGEHAGTRSSYDFPPKLDDSNCKPFDFEKSKFDENCSHHEFRENNVESDACVKNENVPADMVKCEIKARDTDEKNATVDNDSEIRTTTPDIKVDVSNIEDESTTLSNQNVNASCLISVREFEKNDEPEQQTTPLISTTLQLIDNSQQDGGCNVSLVDKLDANSRRDFSMTATDKLDKEHVDEAIQETVELMVESVEVESEDKTDSTIAVKNEDDGEASSEQLSMHRDSESNGQQQFEKYIAYSPPNEHSENLKVIPKLVIKKADSLSHKHSCVGSPTTPPAELRSNKIWSKESPNPKSYPHPKIPKILIRNAKSRPSTPSVEEVSEMTSYEITVKDEIRIPKVKIRLEEKGVQGSSLSAPDTKSYVSENKIPIMKIKLENLFGECFRKSEQVSKTVPKMKIKKLKNSPKRTGSVKILPVSIPKMLVCTKRESEMAKNIVMSDDDDKPVSSNPIACESKEVKIRSDSKKIPKLKIKRQGSNCSLESHGKRRNQSPIENEMKKSKKSLAVEIGTKKQSNHKSQNVPGIPDVSENLENGEKLSVCNENSAPVLVASHVKSNPLKSDSSDKIPKVIIKRASSSAEFKCELSKTKCDELIKTKKWQPEVKLQRSWVLDCMAKDLNLDKLTLKLATPDSISKKCISQNKAQSIGSNNAASTEKQDSAQKILYKSKSTSDLVSFRDNYEFCHYDLEQSNEDEKTISPETPDASEKSECYFKKLSMSSENIPNKKKKRFEIYEPVSNHISSLENTNESSYLPNTFNVTDDIIVDNKVLDENMNSKNKVLSKMNNFTVSNDAREEMIKTRNDIHEGYAASYNSVGMKNQDNINSCNKSSDKGSISKEEKKTSRIKDDKFRTVQKTFTRNETGSLKDTYICSRKKTAADCNSDEKGLEVFEDKRKIHSANYCNDASEILHILSGSGSPDPTTSTIELSTINTNDTSNSIEDLRVNEIRTSNVFATSDLDLQRENFLDSNENHVSDSFVKDCETLKDGVKLSNGLDKSVDVELRSLNNDTRRTVEIFSTSPDFGQCRDEISSFPFESKGSNICLYHEDAIPAQFELELGITDSVSPVPIEQSNDFVDCYEEVDTYSDASYADQPKLTNTTVQTNVAVSTKLLRNDGNQGTTNLSCDAEMDTNCSSEQNVVTPGDIVGSRNNSYYADLLVKEVLAAKEMLRKCLASSSRDDHFKSTARPKTPAEKKQGASFNLSALSSGSDTLTGNMINRCSENSILTGENSGKKIRLFNDTGSNEAKPLVNKSKARLKLNVVKYEKQHSKNEKNIFTVQPSKTPGNFEAVDDTEHTDSYVTPQRGWIELQDSVELSNDKTTISLKNSKRFVENTSCRNPSKNIPELINSKDNKCKSKSTRHDAVDWKIIEKSKKKSSRAVISKSSVDVADRREKSVSDTESCKYKSLNLASGRLLGPVTDKPKFKSYKIPKILKTEDRESKNLFEELASSRYGDDKMPILEPEVDFHSGFLVSNSDTNRDSSRPPPLITSLDTEVIDQPESWDLDQKSCQQSPTPMEKVASAEETRSLDEKVEIMPLYEQEMTVAYVVRDLAYHEKATIKHKRYCTLCERWFPTVARHRRHLTGYQHRHTELTQRRTIHALFTLFTGKPCPRIQPASVVRIDCVPGELTPLQIAVQGLAGGLDKTGGDSRRPSREDE